MGIFTYLNHKEVNKEVSISVKVVQKNYEQPTSGYKTHTDAKYVLMVKEISKGKYIRIETTPDCYMRSNVNEVLYFTITADELRC